MTSNWNAKQKSAIQTTAAANKLSDKSADYSVLTAEDLEPTWNNKELGILGCKHYQRSSKLQGHCCGRWFPCRFCHDEVSDHNIVRYVKDASSPLKEISDQSFRTIISSIKPF